MEISKTTPTQICAQRVTELLRLEKSFKIIKSTKMRILLETSAPKLKHYK